MNILAPYKPLFQTRQNILFIASSFLGRLPMGFETVGILLYYQSKSVSIAFAGTITAVFALSGAICSPIQGRMLDRLPQTTVFLPLAIIHASAFAGLIFTTSHLVIALILGFISGATIPRIPARSRVLWTHALEEERNLLRTALALESIMSELSWVIGPLLLSLIATAFGPLYGIVTASTIAIIGTVAFLITSSGKASSKIQHRTNTPIGFFGPLNVAGVRLTCYAMIIVGIGYSVMEIFPTAATKAAGKPAFAGVLIAVFSAASIIGGLFYGTLTKRPDLKTTLPCLVSIFPLSIFVTIIAEDHMALFVVLVIPSGLLSATLMTVASELLEVLTAKAMLTEAFTWLITALFVGFSAGSTLSGILISLEGWKPALMEICFVLLLLTLPIWFKRHLLSV